MVARAEESVFWPGLTLDIMKTRDLCSSCREYAPSQTNLPPWDPVSVEYPFQHVCADYLQYAGFSYGIVVDRFSNWFKVYEGKGGASVFIKVMQDLVENFNIPETLTTDGGTQYTAHETQEFLKQYGIQHRLCSVCIVVFDLP